MYPIGHRLKDANPHERIGHSPEQFEKAVKFLYAGKYRTCLQVAAGMRGEYWFHRAGQKKRRLPPGGRTTGDAGDMR